METPFTTEQFFEVFEKYNSSVFPIQLIFIGLGIVGIFLIHSKRNIKNTLIGAFLGFMWLWIGVVYHISFFTSINKAALGFGGLFIIQGIFFFIEIIDNY